MLGFLAEEGGKELNTSSGDGAVGSEDLELRDGELDFSTLIGDVVEGVREGALEDVQDEGRGGYDGVVGNLRESRRLATARVRRKEASHSPDVLVGKP